MYSELTGHSEDNLEHILTELNLDHPHIPPTSQSLAIQAAITTRKSVSRSYSALASNLKYDAVHLERWIRATIDADRPENLLHGKSTVPLHEQNLLTISERYCGEALSSVLPRLHDQLAMVMAGTTKPLEALRDAKLGDPPKIELDEGLPPVTTSLLSVAQSGTTLSRYEAFQQVEKTKWEAYQDVCLNSYALS
jgi:hypothetical protein